MGSKSGSNADGVSDLGQVSPSLGLRSFFFTELK